MSTTSSVTPALDGALVEQRSSGFWTDYFRSLKALEVEEYVDLYIHRPFAHLLTKILYPTSISPNMVTVVSIVCGLIAGFSLFVAYPWHLQVAGLAIFLSAIFDCADGQLARLRGTSSAFGRMLDGTADLVVIICAVGGGIYWIGHKYQASPWIALLLVGAVVATVVTGSFHTGMYDYYKNVFLRLIVPGFADGEDLETAKRRRSEGQNRDSLGGRIVWSIYLFYVSSQEKVVRNFDPYTFWSINRMPGYDSRYATIYRRHATGVMRVWRSLFGFGALVFGLAFAIGFDVLEYYVVARLLLQNLLYYCYLRPAQRRASREAFAEMGIDPVELQQPVAA